MSANSRFQPYLTRLLLTFLVSAGLVAAINEGAYLFQKEKYDRPPQTVQLLIPSGTALRVAAGEQPPGLPQKMVFVVGDVLEVKNEDTVAHQLGPVWVPPGASGRLTLDQPNRYSYSCSFSAARFLGLEVRKPTTLATRLSALAIGVPPMTAFLFIYSLAAFPLKPKVASPPSGAV